MEHPAYLLELADGRVLLTYGDRSAAEWSSTWPDGSPGKGGQLAVSAAVKQIVTRRAPGGEGLSNREDTAGHVHLAGLPAVDFDMNCWI